MNLTRALEVALPDIPARKLAESYPRLDPGTTFREHIERGRPVVRIYVPCVGGMYTFEKSEWELTKLFDGRRSYEEIADLYSQQNGIQYDVETVREFAASLESSEFWYKTPQEKNIQLMQLSREERRKKLQQKKSIWADLSDVDFPAFNPDRVVTWVHNKTRFIYTPWFTIASVISVMISIGITVAHWPEIQRDTVEFYSFAKKTWIDVVALYTLGMFVVGVHEFAHAHACKHYGGRVPAMGFALVYLMPAFFTDTTEGFVHGTHYQRLIISFAGVWSEMLLCSIATPIWWGTPPETLAHSGAHFIMMMTGILALVLNWNPLIKLDGYYMLCDLVGIQDLKEDSTAYTSAWVRKHVWRLPSEVPYVPKSRRLGFVVYALASGAYSYSVLYVVAHFAGNFVRNFSPEWGFIPEIGVAFVIFRSRIRLLGNFMKLLYLDKKDVILAWFTPKHSAMAAGIIGLLLAVPVWKESVTGKFVLEPSSLAVVRAYMPGTISRIYVQEGDVISQGAALATLKSLPLESRLNDAGTRLLLASAQAKEAARNYQGYGNALMEREQSTRHYEQVSEMNAALEMKAPISGTVTTPKIQDQLGAYLKAGTEFLEIADLTRMRARIYVSEYELYKIRAGQAAKLQFDGRLPRSAGEVSLVSARPVKGSQMEEQKAEDDSSSAQPRQFFFVDIVVPNPEQRLKPGMTGVARVYASRRSLGGMALEEIKNFWGRKLW
ncbi:MAG TPA: efflux RND transporter periplasmic adaptor subunit [Candidatus Acidoferrum sp.]|nr:efflux RND transporter periplasmic adaptor subunit [Candidatus Acidoferrum sp.]